MTLVDQGGAKLESWQGVDNETESTTWMRTQGISRVRDKDENTKTGSMEHG